MSILENSKPAVGTLWRKLEAIGRHVAIGTRAAIPFQTSESSIEEGPKTTDDCVARLAATFDRLAFRRRLRATILRRQSRTLGSLGED